MARRSRARDLAGLAALGALGYTFFGPGRDRKDGTKAPVEYRDVSGAAPGRVAPSSAAPAVVAPAVVAPNVAAGLRETFMGLDDVSGPRAETGGVGRVNVSAADQTEMPPPVFGAQAQAAQAAQARRPAAAPAVASSASRSFAPAASTRARTAGGAAAAAPQTSQMTREYRISQIPTGGTQTVEGGRRVTGNEFTRNVGNILNAPVVGMLPVGRAVRGAASLRQPPAAVPALPAPQARLTGPSKADLLARDRAARQEQLREQVRRENAANYGLDPNAPGYEAAVRALTRDLGGRDFTLKKKGGAVKAKPKKMASGGMSSASKRADGIATKGKTKCKMY